MNATLRRLSIRLLCGILMGHGSLALAGDTDILPARPAIATATEPAALPAVPDVATEPRLGQARAEDTAAPTVDPQSPILVQDASPLSPWSLVPPITPMPRLGGFVPPYTGPGYFTLWGHMRGNYLAKPPTTPFPPISAMPGTAFDADTRYLEDPNNDCCDWLNCRKRIHFGDCWMLSTGGEFRIRLMDETNSRLLGGNNSYNLMRYRANVDIWYTDLARFYMEFLGANSYNQSLPPLAIDNNPADILNMFVDVKVVEEAGAPLYVRVGRQELLYGSQRLISPLDWANTRRTFQGAKAFWHGSDWDVDVFWVKPVIPNANNLDDWDRLQNFSGAWLTYKPKKGTAVDLYVLNSNTTRPVAVGRGGVRGGFDITTFGSRLSGDFDGRWLFDAESMLQTGSRANQEMVAGAYTVGGGYRAKNCSWNPTAWVYYDFASGDPNPGGPGRSTTFAQTFAFGHYYLGFNDFVGRQNIHDFNMQWSVSPLPWWLVLIQYHNFMLDSSRDALYNAGGVAIRRSPAGAAGKFVGQELDVITNIHLTNHQDMLFGYSRFFAGSFIQNTGNPNSANLFYAQYSFKW